MRRSSKAELVFGILACTMISYGQGTGEVSKLSHHGTSARSIASYKVVDLMPSFWRFWERAQTLDQPAKIQLFRELVPQPNKDVFEAFAGPSSDERLAQYFVKVQPFIAAMRGFYERFNIALPRYGRTFAKYFPDADGRATIYFMPNLLGGWDAGSVDLNGHTALVFGVDSIVQLHKGGFDIAPLFHHELFHMYRAQFHSEWNGKSRMKGEIPLY